MRNSVFNYFLKLGATGFGGPLSIIHQIRTDLVVQQKVLSEEEFDQAFTFIKAMPGPIALQMAVYCGKKLNGHRGAFLAATGLILPAFLMMLIMSLFYLDLKKINSVNLIFEGMQYSAMAIVLWSIFPLTRPHLKNIHFWLMGISAGLLFLFKIVPESILIIGFGIIYAMYSKARHQMLSLSPFLLGADIDILKGIFLTCFKAGALVFGTGLAVFPFFQSTFVETNHWLSITQFNDAVTFGQMTPGPVTISATFMGYQMAGFWGAILATGGLYLAPYIHISTWFIPALNWLKKQSWIKYFVLGSTAAVCGCLFVTVFKMSESFLNLYQFWLLFMITMIVLIKKIKIPIYLLLITCGFIHLVIGFAT